MHLYLIVVDRHGRAVLVYYVSCMGRRKRLIDTGWQGLRHGGAVGRLPLFSLSAMAREGETVGTIPALGSLD